MSGREMTDAQMAAHVDTHADETSMEVIAAKAGLRRATFYKYATPGTLLEAAIKRRSSKKLSRKKSLLSEVYVALTDEQIAYLSARGDLSAQARRCVDEKAVYIKTDRELAELVDAHPHTISLSEIASKVPMTRDNFYKRATPGTLLEAALKRREARREEESKLKRVKIYLTHEQIASLEYAGELSAQVRRCVEDARLKQGA